MDIRDIMNASVISVTPETSVTDAVALLIEHHISGLPVVDKDNTIVGVITEKDFLRLFYDEARVVADLMTAKPHAISVDAPLVDVVDVLMSKPFRRVLIHDGGKLVGLVSRADLMPATLSAVLDRATS